MTISRGIRNNNPGNLRRSSDAWTGLADEQTDADFFQFKEPLFGLRALARTLLNYQVKHRLSTLREIVARWAPASENDTAAYLRDVCEETGHDPDKALALDDAETLAGLVEAIVRHENGAQPYSFETVDRAVAMALA